jgi:peptide/nickel transport system ATP-binding protein
MPSNVVFSAKNVSKIFGAGKKSKTAVDNVSFEINDGEIVTIVGGSGCGKSVLAKIMLGLYPPTTGEFLYCGKKITNLKHHWNEVQFVFQDPFSCFNQFFTIRSQLEDSLNILKSKPSRAEVKARVDAGLLAVNVKPSDIEDKYAFELSGGQMQRMLLARIFALRPRVLIADEPTSMVDACVRANILDYLMKLKQELHMTVIFVTHDIGLANYVSDRIFIMHDGKLVNVGTPAEVLDNTTEPHTLKLLDDIPEVHKTEWIKHS